MCLECTQYGAVVAIDCHEVKLKQNGVTNEGLNIKMNARSSSRHNGSDNTNTSNIGWQTNCCNNQEGTKRSEIDLIVQYLRQPPKEYGDEIESRGRALPTTVENGTDSSLLESGSEFSENTKQTRSIFEDAEKGEIDLIKEFLDEANHQNGTEEVKTSNVNQECNDEGQIIREKSETVDAFLNTLCDSRGSRNKIIVNGYFGREVYREDDIDSDDSDENTNTKKCELLTPYCGEVLDKVESNISNEVTDFSDSKLIEDIVRKSNDFSQEKEPFEDISDNFELQLTKSEMELNSTLYSKFELKRVEVKLERNEMDDMINSTQESTNFLSNIDKKFNSDHRNEVQHESTAEPHSKTANGLYRKSLDCIKEFENFSSQSIPNEHNLVHCRIKLYRCDGCICAFTHKDSLKYHRQIHIQPTPKLEHKTCGNGIETNNKLLSDEIKSFSPSVEVEESYEHFQCQNLKSKANISNYKLQRRQEDNPQSDSYLCEHCDMTFSTKLSFDKPCLHHSSCKRFNCFQCGNNFSSKIMLQKHIQRLSNHLLICDRCGRTFKRKDKKKYRKHLQFGKKKLYHQCSPMKYNLRPCSVKLQRLNSTK